MKKSVMLSENEVAVLCVLWKSPAPLSRPEILSNLEGLEWNPNSIHVVINNLIRKGYVSVAGNIRCGQSHGRTYQAAKTPGEYLLLLVSKAVPILTEEESVAALLEANRARA